MAPTNTDDGRDNSLGSDLGSDLPNERANDGHHADVYPMASPPAMTPPASQPIDPMGPPPGMTPPGAPPVSPMGPPGISQVVAPPLGQGGMGPPPPGMSPIGAPPMHLTPPPDLVAPATSPVQLHAAAANAGPRQPMLTPSAPIPMMQQAQALMMTKPSFMDEAPPSNTKKKMIIAAVAGLVVAGVVAVVLLTQGGGDDGDPAKAAAALAGNKPEAKPLSAEHQQIFDKLPAETRDRLKALPPDQLVQILDAKVRARKAEAAKAKAKVDTKPTTKVAASAWDGRRTFVCRGSDVHVFRDIKANTGRRMAILAKNSCTVYCVNCTIISRNRYAVRTHNTAKVYLVGGKIIAKKYALYGLHASTIVYAGTKVLGRKKRQQRAKIRKLKPDQVKVPE